MKCSIKWCNDVAFDGSYCLSCDKLVADAMIENMEHKEVV
jgi:hypothetical protein